MWRAKNKVMTSVIISNNSKLCSQRLFFWCCSRGSVLSLAATLWHIKTRINWQSVEKTWERDESCVDLMRCLQNFVSLHVWFIVPHFRPNGKERVRAHVVLVSGPTLLKWTINDSIFMITYFFFIYVNVIKRRTLLVSQLSSQSKSRAQWKQHQHRLFRRLPMLVVQML